MAAHQEGIPAHMLSEHDHQESNADKAHRAAIKTGVNVCYGTDAGTNYNYHGLNAMQLSLFVEQGIYTPMEAIHCASLASAKAIGL